MARRRWVFEPGDRFVTMAKDGRAYLWSVADNGDVKGRLADMNDRRSGCGYIVTDELCELESGSDEQRAELDRHMAVVEALDEAEVQWALRHALIAAVLYRDEQRPEALDRYARDLLGTMKLHASSRYREAVAEAAERPPGTGTIPLEYLLDVLRRDIDEPRAEAGADDR